MMALVCIWQFVLTFPTKNVESNAEESALSFGETGSDGYNKRLSTYLDSVSSEVVWPTPFKDYTYQELKNAQLAYGLDLVGGMSVVMQVDLRDYIRSLAQGTNDPPFDNALDAAAAAQSNTQTDFVTLFQDEFEEANPDKKLASYFLNTGDDDNTLNINSSNAETIRWIRLESTGTVKRTYEMLRERIDRLGVVQPNISLDASRDMIIAELPGIKNPKRARKILEATSKLEFWHTYRNNDENWKIIQTLQDMDTKLKNVLGTDTVAMDIPETITRIDTTFVSDSLGNVTTEIASIDSLQVPNPELLQQSAGPLFSLLTPNAQLSSDGQGSPVIGFAKRNDKRIIDSLFKHESIQNMLPGDLTLMWSRKGDVFEMEEGGEKFEQYSLYGIKKRDKDDVAPLEGDVITTAGTQNNSGQIEVTLGMNSEGASTWYQMTKRASDNGKREVGIVLDNEVVSSPSVRNGAISGGRTSISGNFDVQEANDLAQILEIGKLPAKPVIIQEAIVGPTLGADNTSRSLTALAGGTLLVLLFMMGYYGGAGIVSIIALLLNVAFIFGSLASFGTVLTLPGIAGIVLTIGMAVDANVIIYERIREELRAGKSNAAAIRDGFSHSYSAIIDANVTTLLVAGVLAYFGLGPIKGFAVVLIIGVLCSLFTAVLVG